MWECFCDQSYYDMWAVRHTDDKRFNSAIHVRKKEEAEFLVERLNNYNELRSKVNKAMAIIKHGCDWQVPDDVLKNISDALK